MGASASSGVEELEDHRAERFMRAFPVALFASSGHPRTLLLVAERLHVRDVLRAPRGALVLDERHAADHGYSTTLDSGAPNAASAA
jgi:hypothetical protein